MENRIFISSASPPRKRHIGLVTTHKNQPKLMASCNSLGLLELITLRKQMRKVQNGEINPFEYPTLIAIITFRKENIMIEDQFFEEADNLYFEIKDFEYYMNERISFLSYLRTFSKEKFLSLITNSFSLIKDNPKKFSQKERLYYITFLRPKVKTYTVPFPEGSSISVDFCLSEEDLFLDSKTFSEYLYFNEQILLSEDSFQKPL